MAKVDLRAAAKITGLSAMSPKWAFGLFKGVTSAAGFEGMTLELFRTCFAHRSKMLATSDKRHQLAATLAALYSLFDANGDGMVDSSELMAGITVLCGGTSEEKARAVFTLYDTDNNGTIEFTELQCYLVGVFTMMQTDVTQERSLQDVMSTLELARSTATEAFADSAIPVDGSLTWTEFYNWYMRSIAEKGAAKPPPPPSGVSRIKPPPLPPSGPKPEPSAGRRSRRRRRGGRQKSSMKELGVDLTYVRRVTGLASCAPLDVLEEFAEAADADSTISLSSFVRVFDDIIDEDQLSPADAGSFKLVIPALYVKPRFRACGHATIATT